MKFKMRIGDGSALALVGLLFVAMSSSAASVPLSLPWTNCPSVEVGTLRNYAFSNQFTAYTSVSNNDAKTFRGIFTPASSSSKLAIHSDDGSQVTIGGQSWGTAGAAASLNLDNSWTEIGFTFTANQDYCIEIQYFNATYSTNSGDRDGVTLYAYDGGGSFRTGLIIDGNSDAVYVGNTLSLTVSCGTPNYGWTSSVPATASVSQSGGDRSTATITGIKSGMVSITATDSVNQAISRTIHVVKPGISPGALTTCVGVANTFVLTNSAGTGTVMWSDSGTLTGGGRTNVLAFGSPGTKTLTATYAGCTVTSSIVVVGVASLTADATNFCGSGTVIYTATSTPAGYESQLSWGGEALPGTGAKRTNTFSTIGPHVVSVSCGTSVKSITNIVYRMDIVQSSATMLADATAPMTLNLTNSYGTPNWQIMPSGGATVSGGGSTVTVTPGSVGANYTITACASELSSCCDTAVVQVVKVNFNTNLVAFCEGANATVRISIAPTNAPALTFDTVTNVATGTPNTVATISVTGGTNLTITPVSPGTATVRVRLGNSTSFGPVIKVVRVTFPAGAWYVGEGKSESFVVQVQPPDAPVTFTTKEAGIATATGSGSNVTVTGVSTGTTRVIAVVGGVGCVDKDLTVARVTFSPTPLYICVGKSDQSTATVTPSNTPVTYVVDDPSVASLGVSGNTLTVTCLAYGETFIHAKISNSVLASLPVYGVRVDFDTNAFVVLQGGNAVLKATIYPELDAPVMFESSNTNVARVSVTGGRRSDITILGVTNGYAAITARIGSNQLCATKGVLVARLGLEVVRFGGTNRAAVLKDDATGAFDDVYHWTKLTNSPISYARSTHPAVAATISILPASVANVVLVRGEGAYPISATNTTASGGYIVSGFSYSPNSLPNQVDVIAPLIINWSVSFDNGATYLPVGSSSNTVYVTWANSLNPIHTLLDVGCRGAQGVSGAEQSVFDAIWQNKILSKAIHRASDGRTLSYYGFLDVNSNGTWNAGVDTDFNSPGTCSITDAVGLIRDGNGQCHSWADFLHESLRCQGISNVSGNAVTIQGVRIKGPYSAFAVKNWNVTGSSPRDIISYDAGVDGLSPVAPFPSSDEATDAAGVAGQGNSPNPPSRFLNHFIIRIGQTLYDPSYAIGPYTDRKKYETAAFAGRISTVNNPHALYDAPADDNDPSNHDDEINTYP